MMIGKKGETLQAAIAQINIPHIHNILALSSVHDPGTSFQAGELHCFSPCVSVLTTHD